MSTPIQTDERPHTDRQREKEIRQAEELLFSGPQRRSVAKELFWGRLAADMVLALSAAFAGRAAARWPRPCGS